MPTRTVYYRIPQDVADKYYNGQTYWCANASKPSRLYKASDPGPVIQRWATQQINGRTIAEDSSEIWMDKDGIIEFFKFDTKNGHGLTYDIDNARTNAIMEELLLVKLQATVIPNKDIPW
jgi:hypothetical protein|tara:strand:- start:623 stop:982 length:360 start_codon:yes stop_codon:yes gene_type:complete